MYYKIVLLYSSFPIGVPTITVIICGVTKVYGKYTFYTGEENSTITPL